MSQPARDAGAAFVALYAYPLFNPAAHAIFGGSEVRAWLYATALARRALWPVSFVVMDHGQPALECRDGVTIHAHSHYRCPDPHGWVGPRYLLSEELRAFYERRGVDGGGVPRWQGLCISAARRLRRTVEDIGPRVMVDGYRIAPAQLAVYKRVRAKVFCVLGVSSVTLEAAAHCARSDRRLLLMLGSDEDLSESYFGGSRAPNYAGVPGGVCYAALQRADAIVAQTEHQRTLLRERFGRDAYLVRNPVNLETPAAAEGGSSRKHVLWIGKADGNKRPALLLELARQLPKMRFELVMNRSDPRLYESVTGALPQNVRFHERVDFATGESLFANAIALVNTSLYEGFPNTFLQAAKHSVPILSLVVDPDGMVSREGCGVHARGDLRALRDALARLGSHPSERAAIGAAARAYVERRHALADRVTELADVIEQVAASGSSIQSVG